MNLFNKITDENLRLAIIQELADNDEIDLPTLNPDDFVRDYLYSPNNEVKLALLSKLSIDDNLLLSINSIEWSAGSDIQHIICPHWDGEDDGFNIKSLDGIENLSSLTSLYIELGSVKDLTPLSKLPILSKISLELDGIFDTLTPLLTLPELKSVHLTATAPDAAQVRDILTSRGVETKIR